MSLLPSSSRSSARLLANTFRRTYATYTELPRPPPSKQPEPETFSSPAKPGAYYDRPQPRALPPLQKKWPVLLALGVFGTGAWATFYAYVANQEKLASSVFKQIVATIKDDSELQAVLGDAIRPEPAWWLNGEPWISGGVHLMQGSVDLSFRVKGPKGAGTLYFTSIRKAKGEPFTILRFKVITDDGQIVHIRTRSGPLA
ncbi:unnamed protein product [Somion occarium]|uniref:DUF1783-domain-containing protein n=1 Tax=Somion occarium TaxID=3059160 RepID=A0ABP1DCE0_9APHY